MPLGVPPWLALCVCVPLGVTDELGVPVELGVRVCVPLGVTDELGVPVELAVSVPELLGVSVAEGDCDCVPVWLRDCVCVAV